VFDFTLLISYASSKFKRERKGDKSVIAVSCLVVNLREKKGD